jgi:hypothetical protein
MRNLTGGVASTIAQKLGVEAINIVEIQWAVGGNFNLYSDKEIPEARGIIQEIGILESVLKLDQQGQSDAISVILSDTDGTIKNIINNNNIHGKMCRVSQWFQTLPITEKFILYEGQISSPISWSEGDRTLSFDVITQLSDKEVGFSPEEGNFPYIPTNLIGVPWPLAFGHVQNVPATTLQEVPDTRTAESNGIADPSLLERINELNEQRNFLNSYLLTFLVPAQGIAAFWRDFGTTAQLRAYGAQLYPQIQSLQLNVARQILSINEEIARLQADRSRQLADQKNSIKFVDGSLFTQGTSITFIMGDVELTGTMSGDTFNISSRVLTKYTGSTTVPFGFTFLQAGTNVRIKTTDPIIYIVNIIPCTVESVSAFMRLENDDILTIVPPSLYTVKTTVLGVYTITYLTFNTPLSSFDERFQNDIYVTQTGNIGPNTVDILEWAINTYTNLSIDATSFADVKTKLENYPSNFALLTRKNIILFLEEVALQARCALWIKQNTVYIKYLSEEQVADDTITESDIDAGSLILTATNTEELVTKLTASWVDDYANPDPYKIILRHNIEIYGTREREIDFYIYNIGELVLKSATFWLIRLANVWKHISFKTYLHKLALETYDTINFNFATDYIATTDVKGLLTNVTYDSSEQILNIEALLPVKFGEMTAYPFVWPMDIDPDINLFPTNTEIAVGYAGGNGPGKDVEGGFELTGRELFITFSDYVATGTRFQARDYGDLKPSDVNDVKPEVAFIGKTVIISDDPGHTSFFDDQSIDLDFPPLPIFEYSSVFPGKILSQDDVTHYTCEVYTLGMTRAPVIVQVRQLQIDPPSDGSVEEKIPTGSWTLVMQNRVGGTDQAPEVEYTMQVPVWL